MTTDTAKGQRVLGKRILGIDPGSLTTGIGIVDSQGDRIQYVHHVAIRSNAKLAFSERLRNIYTQVQSIVVEFKPDAISIEKVFMHRNADSALKLGQARASALAATFSAGIPIHEFSPKSIKQAVVGKGAASKEQVQHMVGYLLNIKDPIQEDAADALAAAICHANFQHTADRLNVDIATIEQGGQRRRRRKGRWL